ncbi:MAG: PKD domain-containing protein [Saprospiraceae bacterium]
MYTLQFSGRTYTSDEESRVRVYLANGLTQTSNAGDDPLTIQTGWQLVGELDLPNDGTWNENISLSFSSNNPANNQLVFVNASGNDMGIDDVSLTCTSGLGIDIMYTSMGGGTFEFEFDVSNQPSGVSITDECWTFGDGSSSSGSQVEHTYAAAGVYYVCVTITTNCGCVSTHCEQLIVYTNPNACMCPGVFSSIYEVGSDLQSVTNLSETNIPLSANLLLDACIIVNGRFIWDTDLQVNSSHFIMNEGSAIEIDGDKFMMLDNTVLEGCDHMWRGITANISSQFEAVNNTTIRDAQYAVTALDGSLLYIKGTIFDRNYTGIYVPPSTNGQPQVVYEYMMENNQFICTDKLKTPYNLQSPTPGEYTAVGIDLNDAVGFNIGDNNGFTGIANGVSAIRSTFSMSNSNIYHLVQSIPGSNFDQIGVYAFNCALANVRNNEMEEVTNGILCYNSNLSVDDNEITGYNGDAPGQNFGISYADGLYRNVRIRRNEIERMWNAGIDVYNAPFPADFKVQGNTVKVLTNTTGGLGFSSCSNGLIAGNTVLNANLNAAAVGMGFGNCFNLDIYDNDIFDLGEGIQINGGSGHYIVENNINSNSGSAAAANQSGVGVFISLNKFCGNTTNGQNFLGWYFVGECTPSELTCNTIEDAGTGLFLYANLGGTIPFNTIIGPQVNRGNQWTGTYSFIGAQNVATDDGVIGLSRFRMPALQIPSWITGAGGQSGDWFDDYTSDPIACNTACPIPSESPDDPGEGETLIGDNDISASKGEIAGEGMLWVAQQRLYERLMKYPEMVDDNTDVQAFYNTAATSSLGALYSVRMKIDSLERRDFVSYSAMQSLQATLEAISDTLLLLKAAGPGSQQAAWESSIRALTDSLAAATVQYYAQEANLDTLRKQEASIIAAQNDNISTTHWCDSLDKAFNALYLQNHLWLPSDIDSADLAAIKSIADLCPLAAGVVVYAARSAYKRFVMTANWDDLNENCVGAEERSQSGAQTPKSGFSITPNPANEYLTMLWEEPFTGEMLFELTSPSGQVTKRLRTQGSGQTSIHLDTKSLPQGMYFYRVLINGQSTQSGKIIIAH